jgi:alkaline phosphatase D
LGNNKKNGSKRVSKIVKTEEQFGKWFSTRSSSERMSPCVIYRETVLTARINHRWTSQTPENASFIVNYDAWDGYQANRNRLLKHVYDEQIDNVFVVTGDTHANWLFENNLETTLQGTNDTATLKTIATTENEYQRGTIVEFGGTAVSSNGWGNSWGSYENHTVGAKAMVENNPTLLYSDAFRMSPLCHRDVS